mgnify:CR=1 FL=1
MGGNEDKPVSVKGDRGVEYGRGHYPVMVVLHTGLLVGAVAEVWLLEPERQPALEALRAIVIDAPAIG